MNVVSCKYDGQFISNETSIKWSLVYKMLMLHVFLWKEWYLYETTALFIDKKPKDYWMHFVPGVLYCHIPLTASLVFSCVYDIFEVK